MLSFGSLEYKKTSGSPTGMGVGGWRGRWGEWGGEGELEGGGEGGTFKQWYQFKIKILPEWFFYMFDKLVLSWIEFLIAGRILAPICCRRSCSWWCSCLCCLFCCSYRHICCCLYPHSVAAYFLLLQTCGHPILLLTVPTYLLYY